MDLTVASRCGADRTVSEDRWVALPTNGGVLLAVADGMGGTVGGGAAASAALAALVEVLAGRAPVGARALAGAVAAAHARVRALAADGMPAALRGGTTLTVAVVSGRRLHVAHAGDSSCWLLRRGRLRRLTETHTHAAALVAAGAIEPGSAAEQRLDNLLTRYVGMPGAVHPQHTAIPVRHEDRILVVTDGVSRALTVPVLGALLARPGVSAADLVEAAAAAGGRDDATALLVTVDTTMDTATGEMHTRYAIGEGIGEVRAG